MNDTRYLASACAGLIAQVVVPLALYAWGRWVARRHGGSRAWRRASVLPIVAFGVSLLGYVVTIAMLVWGFRHVTSLHTAERATALARAISHGMNATALAVVVASALYLVSIGAFLYGSFTPRKP